jgi:hypothetical protein
VHQAIKDLRTAAAAAAEGGGVSARRWGGQPRVRTECPPPPPTPVRPRSAQARPSADGSEHGGGGDGNRDHARRAHERAGLPAPRRAGFAHGPDNGPSSRPRALGVRLTPHSVDPPGRCTAWRTCGANGGRQDENASRWPTDEQRGYRVSRADRGRTWMRHARDSARLVRLERRNELAVCRRGHARLVLVAFEWAIQQRASSGRAGDRSLCFRASTRRARCTLTGQLGLAGARWRPRFRRQRWMMTPCFRMPCAARRLWGMRTLRRRIPRQCRAGRPAGVSVCRHARHRWRPRGRRTGCTSQPSRRCGHRGQGARWLPPLLNL